MRFEQKQVRGGDNDDADDAPSVNGMQHTHLAFGVFARQGGDDGANQNFAKTACRREDHRAKCDTHVRVYGEKVGYKRVYEQAHNGQYGHNFDDFWNVEFVREEGKYQVHDELRAEVNKHQQAQKGIGQPVRFPKGEKEQGG